MSFLNPIYLWGFLGLAVPIAIHLWSKREGRTIKIGSIKLLRQADPKQTSTIKLNEYWLLFLRMLLISLLVLILAEPQVRTEVKPIPVMYLVEPSLLSYKQFTPILDSLEEGPSLRLLSKGFPELQKDAREPDDPATPDYWKLTSEMRGLPADSIVVFTNAFLSGVRGIRPQIDRSVNWVILDQGDSQRTLVEAWKKEEEVQLVSVVSDHQKLSFKKEMIPFNSSRIQINQSGDSVRFPSEGKMEEVALNTEKAIGIQIFYADSLEDERNYIQSSFRAIGMYLNRPVRVGAVKDLDSLNHKDLDLLVWLSEEPPVETSAPLLLYKPDNLATSILEQGPSRNIFLLTKSLNVENTVDEHLPERLLALLDLHTDLEKKLSVYDKRVEPRELFLPVDLGKEVRNRNYSQVLRFSVWLWPVFLLVLLAERILARYKKQ